jgi:hypothetical protein
MLRRFWDGWELIAHKIGNFQSRVLLNVFYFLILMRFGLGVNLFADPLRLKLQRRSYWSHKHTDATARDHARRQF